MKLELYDASTKQIVQLDREKFQKKLDQVKEILERYLERLETVGGHKLAAIKVSVGFESGLPVIFNVTGGIELTYGAKSS